MKPIRSTLTFVLTDVIFYYAIQDVMTVQEGGVIPRTYELFLSERLRQTLCSFW